METIETRRLVISGRVQGVGFRYWMAKTARGLGLAGWVRNRSDGSVEALVQGEPAAVTAIIERARNGPPGASVTHLDIGQGSGRYYDFSVVDTL